MNYDWDFSIFLTSAPALLKALIVTLELSIYSSILGTILGIPIALFLNNKVLKYIALPLNDVFRAIPLLVLMFLFYYFPYEILSIPPLSSYTCALLAMIFAQAVFTADVIRGALNNISQNAILGAQSIGMKRMQVFWLIVLPDIIRQVLPTLIAFYIGNIKLSSLASAINANELLFAAKVISGQKFRSLEAWVLVAIIYVILVLPLSFMSRKLENSKWIKMKQ